MPATKGKGKRAALKKFGITVLREGLGLFPATRGVFRLLKAAYACRHIVTKIRNYFSRD